MKAIRYDNMGGIDKLLSDIRNQFLSLYDGVLFIADHDKCTKEQALNFIKLKMLDSQLYLLLIDDIHLEKVELHQDEYYFDENYQGETITKTVIIQELQTSIAQGKATHTIENYGFGAKCFYDTAKNLGVEVPEELLYNAQSPNCYHDIDNPLTLVVKELQEEIKALKDGNTEILKLRARIAELEKGQVKKPNTKAQNNFGKVINALLVEAELENDEPYNYSANSTNSIIHYLLQELGTPLQPQAIGNILSIAKSQLE